MKAQKIERLYIIDVFYFIKLNSKIRLYKKNRTDSLFLVLQQIHCAFTYRASRGSFEFSFHTEDLLKHKLSTNMQRFN